MRTKKCTVFTGGKIVSSWKLMASMQYLIYWTLDNKFLVAELLGEVNFLNNLTLHGKKYFAVYKSMVISSIHFLMYIIIMINYIINLIVGFSIYVIGGEKGIGTGRFIKSIWRFCLISRTWYHVTE